MATYEHRSFEVVQSFPQGEHRKIVSTVYLRRDEHIPTTEQMLEGGRRAYMRYRLREAFARASRNWISGGGASTFDRTPRTEHIQMSGDGRSRRS